MFIVLLFIKIGLKYSLRRTHGKNPEIKIIIHYRDMILKDYIILKLGQQNIASVLFSLDLVADIIIHICTGNLTRITGSFDFFLNCSV